MARTTREKVLVLFCDHLQNIIGGCKKERQAILHTQHVRRVHDLLDPKKEDGTIESLLRNGGIDVWRKWAKPQLDEKKMRPGSVKSYFTSLVKFCEFILDQVKHKVTGFPFFPADVLDAAKTVTPRFKQISSSISKVYVHEKWQKRLDDEERALDPSIAANMMETEEAKEAIKILQMSFHIQPNEKKFMTARDFLIARIELENCQRPGPIESVRVEDFKRVKEVEGKFIMRVAKHKNAKAGPAPLTMSSNLMSNLKAYVEYIRPHFAKDDVEDLFVTRDGNAFPDGTIGKRITAFLKKASGLEVTSTQLRKMGSSETIFEDPVSQGCVQAVMTH